LSGEFAGHNNAQMWLPKFEAHATSALRKDADIFVVPSAPAEITARLAIALHSLKLSALTAVAFLPVSSSGGKPGIEELELQTAQLLSFQTLGKQVFDAQVAFTMLDRFGPASNQKLQASLEILRREVRSCLPSEVDTPPLQLLHAPVYYTTTVSACAFVDAAVDAATIAKTCAVAGFSITSEDAAPSNVSAVGETTLQLATPQADPANSGAWWFWAAADNLHLPAANAVKLAEKLLE
jgi:aspartate-semialdehyde dehydrogenase